MLECLDRFSGSACAKEEVPEAGPRIRRSGTDFDRSTEVRFGTSQIPEFLVYDGAMSEGIEAS